MISRREDPILKAVTGLEGGVVASGSTCGVLTGGALGFALMHEKTIKNKGIAAKAAILTEVGEYISWFKREFGTTRCDERTGVDFYTPGGQIRYFLPGDRVGRCFWHIKEAIRHLYDFQGKALHLTDVNQSNTPTHCAKAVLTGVRDKTGVGDPLLENLAFVFDGGVGLKGGICGTLAGAIMAMNLLFGMDISDMRYTQTIKGFLIGHLNLLLSRPLGMPDTFAIGKDIVNKFKNEAGGINCREIIEKDIKDWDDFQIHMSSSDKCKGLIDFAVDTASNAIERLR